MKNKKPTSQARQTLNDKRHNNAVEKGTCKAVSTQLLSYQTIKLLCLTNCSVVDSVDYDQTTQIVQSDLVSTLSDTDYLFW